jgi:ABC-type multidrug transport system fused ATPase/permease subunit
MDEATSALDYENETFIQNNIENTMKGKTIISIAHRFSTIENSDKIIVLKKGELAEEGTYK